MDGATLNLIDGTTHDVWSVNTEADYHEEGRSSTNSLAPTSPRPPQRPRSRAPDSPDLTRVEAHALGGT